MTMILIHTIVLHFTIVTTSSDKFSSHSIKCYTCRQFLKITLFFNPISTITDLLKYLNMLLKFNKNITQTLKMHISVMLESTYCTEIFKILGVLFDGVSKDG